MTDSPPQALPPQAPVPDTRATMQPREGQPRPTRPPWVRDVIVALVVGGIWFLAVRLADQGGYWHPRWISTYWWAGAWMVFALAGRRTIPWTVFWLTMLCYPLGYRTGLQSDFHVLPILIAAFGATHSARVRPAVAVVVAGAAGLSLRLRGGPAITSGWDLRALGFDFQGRPSTVLVMFALTTGAVALGVVMHRLALSSQSLINQNAELQRLQGVVAEQAVSAERLRIARELHDVVAHHMSAIVIRAQAATRVAPNQPDAPLLATEWIAEAGKDALKAMRTIVDMLRESPGEGGALTPAPRLDDLRGAAQRMAQAGLDVTVMIPEVNLALGPAAELALVRIAQESLTNVLLHSTATTATLSLSRRPRHIVLTVHDPGPARPPTQPGEARRDGNGVRNMGERAVTCGGRFSAGPDPDGGWLVRAHLPKDL
ncbi:sensor histidine kinase [Sanguibacter gelidistatuariae]|uniref:sensor histidine kinase n=1 Tax=Sanguibacter gelidistatuariae TaxID=1814289 RepID=UPI00158827DE|nr:histidine kinase [Sanguibacter gelidistatuariae]